jgi:hypothetical protein
MKRPGRTGPFSFRERICGAALASAAPGRDILTEVPFGTDFESRRTVKGFDGALDP